MKYTHIKKFEQNGIKIPKNRGNGFVTVNNCGYHADAINQILRTAKSWAKEYQRGSKQEDYIAKWWNSATGQKLKLNKNDIVAYLHWLALLETDKDQLPKPLQDPRAYAINFLKLAIVGSRETGKHKGIIHADPTPHITFAPWIREGFRLVDTEEYYDYDTESNQYIFKEPTLAERIADTEMKKRLEDELCVDL